MRGVHADLITQALSELSELYHGDEVTLARQLVWIQLLLERTDTIQPLEKDKIQERLAMFDKLWEESPRVQRTREEGVAQGIAQGEVQKSQEMILRFVQTKFPHLTEFAQKKIKLCNNSDTLDQLFQELITASDKRGVFVLVDEVP